MKSTKTVAVASRLVLLAVILSAVAPRIAKGGVPHLINFQGQLKNNSGSPLVNDTLAVEFKIYDAAVSGNIKWSEIDTVITDANGLFTILLGKKTPIPDSVFDDSLRWLGIKVGSDAEISPRSQLGSVGYSYASSQWTSAGQDLFRLNGNVGIGTSNPSAKLDVGGTLLVNPTNQFVGVNRSAPVTGAEYFGVYAPTGNGIFGGMYISTGAYDGLPFYGYKTLNRTAWTSLDGQTGDWKLHLGNSDVLTVLSDGKVGIGTTAPASKLDISAQDGLRIFGYQPFLTLTDANAGYARGIIQSAAGDLNLLTESSLSGGSEYLVIKSGTGNVGIGTATPSARLEVAGDLHVSGKIETVPWTAFPFAAGFGNYGGVSQNVQYRKIGDIVYLRGYLHKLDNSNIGYEVLGTLPVGFRPPASSLIFSVWPTTSLAINSDGTVNAGNPGYPDITLDGVFFSTTP
jgi:hypothetical protein